MNSKQRRQRARQIIRDYPYTLADSYERRKWCFDNLIRIKDYITLADSFKYTMSDLVSELSGTPGHNSIRFKNESDVLLCKLATSEPLRTDWSYRYHAEQAGKAIQEQIDKELLTLLQNNV